jgi:hypothetical protein
VAAIIESRPGVAIAIPNALDVPMLLAVDGWGGYFGFRAILTDFQGELAANVAFAATALDLTYIYAFGDKPGPLSIAGLAFADGCTLAGGVLGGRSGIENVLDFYMANRVAIRAAPCQIHLGAGAGGYFQGFLTGLRFGVAKPESRVAEFALQYHVVPRIRGGF